MILENRLDKPEESGAGKAEPAMGQQMDQVTFKGPPSLHFLWFL